MIRGLLGGLLVLLAGHGLLRLAAGVAPLGCYGACGGVALSWLAGTAVLGLLTTVVGLLGAGTRPLPWLVPPLVLLAVGAARPAMPRPRRPAFSRRLVGDLVSGALAGGVGVVVAALAAPIPVLRTDEFALWMVRGRTLSLGGQLDPLVFLGAAARYQQLDYPLLLPALVAWGDSWVGHPSDAAAHVGVAVLLAAGLAATGWAVNRLAGALPAIAAVILAAATPTVLCRQATQLLADVPAWSFTLPLVCLLALWLRDGGRPLLAAAAVLGAGAGATKVEGLVFALSAFAMAAAVARSRRRRILLAGLAVLAAELPWLAWTRLHGVRSYVLNADTIDPGHLREALPLAGRVWRGIASGWPGLGALLALAALPAAVLALRRGSGRLVAFLAGTVALDVLLVFAQYVVTAAQYPPGAEAARLLDGLVQVSAYRVLLLPAALTSVAVPLLAGAAIRPQLPDAEPGPRLALPQ